MLYFSDVANLVDSQCADESEQKREDYLVLWLHVVHRMWVYLGEFVESLVFWQQCDSAAIGLLLWLLGGW